MVSAPSLRVEDAVHGILDPSHDEAVEQGDAMAGAGAGKNAAAGQEFEIFQRPVKALFPLGLRRRFRARQRARHPPPGVLDRGVLHLAGIAVAVLRIPDVARDGTGKRV
jgi:hypothetical protein